MKLDPKFAQIPPDATIKKTAQALLSHNIDTHIINTIEEARSAILTQIPDGSEVFTISSETLRLGGISEAIDGSERFISVRNMLKQEKDPKLKRKLGSAPDYAIGSIHALTEDGHIWIVSATGSQLASCVYGSEKVIYVVGAHKIVKDDQEAIKRIYDYTLPLESQRTQGLFGTDSRVGKLLTIHDDKPGRTTLYIVKEIVGY